MRRGVFAMVLLLVGATGCQYADTIAPQATPVSVRLGRAVEFTWNGFHVQLDPTVMLWADEAGIDFPRVVRGALLRIETRLHGSPVPISISAGSYLPIPDIGIGGDTDKTTGEVRISMDSRRPTPVKDLLTVWVPVALAHELHHSRRILNGPGYGSTLLEAVVTEGGAEAFVREAFPQAPPIPWVEQLPLAQEAAVWQRLRGVQSAPDDLDAHQQWFVGGGALPHWAGYRIGYEMVRRYLARHPGTSAAQVATMPAGRIYADSGLAQAMRLIAQRRR